MANDDVRELLAQHRVLGPAPVAEREWLIARATRETIQAGSVVNHKSESVTRMIVLLSGHIAIRLDRGAGSHIVFEWHGGDVGGVLPFSRGARPPNDVYAEETCDVLNVSQEHFPEMIRECPTVTATLVHQMLDRARQFNASDMRDEKLVSLGKLAAGIAHELNNPASAAVRSARLLAQGFREAEDAASAMVSAGLTPEQVSAVTQVRELCIGTGEHPLLSPVAFADREDSIAEWLTEHGAREDLAGPLTESGLTPTSLDALAAHIDGSALSATLRWLAAGCLLRTLAWEIETAATRIHALVQSVKGFTYMDHAPTPEPVDIRRGISDTLTMLNSKIRDKSAEVSLQLAPDLPRAHGVGAELNQIWMNLIDNALAAIADGGRVEVTATCEKDRMIVRITDNGAGIPPEIIGRIFDPFFTTKGVGQGTGLGLDIVRRILQRHQGSIDVESRPGHTQFRVVLPIAR